MGKPFRRSDGRWVVVFKQPNGRTTSKSYPRMVMEEALGRPLLSTEHVHHKDGDLDNNDVSNLEVLSHGDHNRLHAQKATTIEVTCGQCNTKFTYSMRRYKDNQLKQGKAGPFCSPPCLNAYRSTIARVAE